MIWGRSDFMKILLKRKRRKNTGVIFSKRKEILDVDVNEALKLSKIYDVTILEHEINKPKKGKNVIFLQELIYKIGGIEEFLTNIATEYEDYNITIYYKEGDPEQLINLSRFVNIKKFDENTPISCDVMLINNYPMVKILDHKYVKSKKTYVIIHADFRGHLKIENIDFTPHKKVDGYIAVSKAAHDGLKEVFGLDSKIIYNFISNNNKVPKLTKFITLSRATKEKGIYRIVEMCELFKKHSKNFIWFLCCTIEQLEDHKPELINKIKSIREIVLIPPSISNKDLIKVCDYVVQLSDVESYCYSLREGLKMGVPIISTDYPEAHNFLKEGKNGYMLNMGLSNVDVDKIFNKIPTEVEYVNECDIQDWIDIFEKGEIDV
jgi:glycosyltransferase involved in cell wall biosynthesis